MCDCGRPAIHQAGCRPTTTIATICILFILFILLLHPPLAPALAVLLVFYLQAPLQAPRPRYSLPFCRLCHDIPLPSFLPLHPSPLPSPHLLQIDPYLDWHPTLLSCPVHETPPDPLSDFKFSVIQPWPPPSDQPDFGDGPDEDDYLRDQQDQTSLRSTTSDPLVGLDIPSATTVTPLSSPKSYGKISQPQIGLDLSFMFLNARKLVRDDKKASLLYSLIKSQNFPHIVAVTEVGCGPGENVFDFFSGTELCQKYSLVWKTRSCSVDGGPITEPKQVGGGILLLVRKSLHVDVDEFHFAFPDEHRKWLHGHFGVWCLKPKPSQAKKSALRRHVVVSVVYAPPISKQSRWGERCRKHIFQAMSMSAAAIKQTALTRHAFHIIFSHLNAQDGGCDVPLQLDCDFAQRQDIQNRVRSHASVPHRASISVLPDSSLVLQRLKSKRTAKTTKQGRDIVAAMASTGMVPINGVMSGRQPDSWQTCAACKRSELQWCACKRAGRWKSHMSNVNDVVFMPALSVVNALLHVADRKTHTLRFSVQRRRWASSIDHAVCDGNVFVPFIPSVNHSNPAQPTQTQELDDSLTARTSVPACTLQKKPALPSKLPMNLLVRHKVLERTRANFRSMSAAAAETDVEVDEPADVNRLNSRLVQLVQKAYQSALSFVLAAEPINFIKQQLSDARRAEVQARRQLHSVLQSKKRNSGNDFKVALRYVRLASSKVRRAVRQHHQLKERQIYEALARGHARAPKDAWRRMERELDPLGVVKDTKCKLLLQLHDTNGKIVSSDTLSIAQHLIDHRRGVFQVRQQLDKTCEQNVNTALAQLHEINRQICNANSKISVNSVCRKSVDDPLHSVKITDQRRNYDRSFDLAEHSEDVRKCMNDIKKRRDDFKAECNNLENDITMQELQSVIAEMQEVGTGVDGMQTAVMKHFKAAELADLLFLLNQVWDEGICPDDWKLVRCLLHYKGKGTDVYCVANYRGLGISDGHCKILSLIMTRRLETFLEATSGISHSQGGFRPQRGPPEQTFTLAETVRAETRTNSVQLCFVDIERAYDSVLHPLLWKRCADVGIGGRFLAFLQAMYDGVSAELEIDQRIVKPAVPIECGVLQGNPLSPLLFNIYIDPIIRSLDKVGQTRMQSGEPPFGIPLPRFSINRMAAQPIVATPIGARTHEDRLVSLWFADDAALPANTTPLLQNQVDGVDAQTRASGLYMNGPKTKWMLVPTQSTTAEEYANQKAVLLQHPLRVGGKAVDLVDDFDYLGSRIWWRWDWSKAWQHAQSRAKKQLGLVKMSGFTFRDWSPYSASVFANGKIFCHFNTIAAVAGAGGAQTSAAWQANEGIITDTLQSLLRVNFVNEFAIRCEFGIWDSRARIDMLSLRFWAKLITCAPESTHFRALCLSFSSLTSAELAAPAQRYSSRQNVHRQPWAQHIIAAAQRFKMDVSLVRALINPAVEVHCRAEPHGEWVALRLPATLVELFTYTLLLTWAMQPNRRFRLAVAEAGRKGFDTAGYIEDINCWSLPHDVTFSTALSSWTDQLRNATFASLRDRGNGIRQQGVNERLQSEAGRLATLPDGSQRQSSGLRHFARLKTGSFFEPYLHLRMSSARRVLQARVDAAPNEGAVRRRPIKMHRGQAKVQTSHTHRKLQEFERACYLCPCIDNCDGLYWPETIEHMLLVCPFYKKIREALVVSLSEFANEPATVTVTNSVDPPDFSNITTLFAVIFLCTNFPRQPILHHHQIPPPPAVLATLPGVRTRASAVLSTHQLRAHADARRRGPQVELVMDVARPAATWINSLLHDWTVKHRDCRSPDPIAAPGHRFVQLIAQYHHDVIRARRIALQNNADFISRSRDPTIVAL